VKFLKEFVTKNLEQKQNGNEGIGSINDTLLVQPTYLIAHSKDTYSILHETIKAFMHAQEVCVHYLLMLIAMTFNVGLFLAIIVGTFFGYLIFSVVRKHAMMKTLTPTGHC